MENNEMPTEKIQKSSSYKKIIISGIIGIILIGGFAGLTKAGYIPNFLNIGILCPLERESYLMDMMVKKPVIYLYPQTQQDIKVQLDYKGEIVATYPEYNDLIKGWDVIANPDGTLVSKENNKEYSYLFWEGISAKKINWDLSTGFMIKGDETREFLQNILPKLGLTPKEYNEFIVYWYPLMKDNPYNLIHFADKDYTDSAPLTITPKPDSMLRVFMVYKPLKEKITIPKQDIIQFDRKGFSVIEWGGTKLD